MLTKLRRKPLRAAKIKTEIPMCFNRQIPFCGFLALMLFSVGAVQGSILYPLNQASTAGFLQGVSVGQVARGWDFQVNAANVSVVQLGVNALSNIPITLTLWDDSSQAELAQLVVTASANAWVFGNLGTFVPLTSGHAYSVIGWADTTASQVPWNLLNNNPPPAFNPTGAIQYLDTRYNNGIGKDTFPTLVIAPPAIYGVTDIGYVTTTPTTTPEPMSFALAAAGIGLFCLGRSRRSLQ